MDARAHCTPEQLRHFWSSIWPEAVRDFSRGGIELQTSDGPGEVRRSAGDNPILTGLRRGVINLVFCGKRRKDGAFIVRRETAKKRLVAKLQAIKTELKRRRHEPVASVGAWLQKVSSGYYQYHAVPGNLDRLQLFRWRLRWLWYRVLSRRSQRSRLSMDRLNRIIDRWIPVPRVLHPYPMQRFDASHPRRERYA